MPHPLVVHCKKAPYDIYAGRGRNDIYGLGNPFSHLPNTLAKFKVASREECVSNHREYFINKYNNNEVFRALIDSFRGKVFGCWCAPLICHCEVIAEYANKTVLDSK